MINKIKAKEKVKIIYKIGIFFILTSSISAKGYYNDIGLQGDNKYKEFYISEEIYENSKNDLKDIRILNSKDEEIPYVIEKYEIKSDFRISDSFRGEVLHAITKKDAKEIILKFYKNNEKVDILANQLEIQVDKNFLTKYTLYGSHDNRKWDYIQNGELYKTPSEEKLIINMYLNNRDLYYSYYKIEMPLTSELVIEKAKLNLLQDFLINDNETIASLNYKIINKELNVKDANTFIRINTKQLPLKRIRLYTAPGEFQRDYTVYSHVEKSENASNNSEKNDLDYGYKHANGSIYRVENREDLQIENLNLENIKDIVLKIENKNDKPLNITGIQGMYYPAKLIFKSEDSNEKYRIIYGAEEYKTSTSYDLANYYKTLEKIDAVNLDEKKEYVRAIIDTDKDKDSSKGYDKLLYKVFIGLLSVMLIIYIVKSLSKKTKD